MKSFKGAAVLDHNFEQCSKEKLNNESSCFIQFRPSSGQDVDGLVARPRLKVLARRLRMHATEEFFLFFLFCQQQEPNNFLN